MYIFFGGNGGVGLGERRNEDEKMGAEFGLKMGWPSKSADIVT